MSGHFIDDCQTHQFGLAANITFTRWWHSHPPKKSSSGFHPPFSVSFHIKSWCSVTLVIMGYGWTYLADLSNQI